MERNKASTGLFAYDLFPVCYNYLFKSGTYGWFWETFYLYYDFSVDIAHRSCNA
jgi:hypothetical protein